MRGIVRDYAAQAVVQDLITDFVGVCGIIAVHVRWSRRQSLKLALCSPCVSDRTDGDASVLQAICHIKDLIRCSFIIVMFKDISVEKEQNHLVHVSIYQILGEESCLGVDETNIDLGSAFIAIGVVIRESTRNVVHVVALRD